MNHFVEIYSLNLKPGMREELHHLYMEEALRLLQYWNFDVWRTVRHCMMSVRITRSATSTS